ncbi:MAG: aminodeoxychorismate synthase component I [Pseudomonadota bacterium]
MPSTELPDPASPACFALLDDCDATAADPRSRLYTRHAGTLACEQAAGLPALLDDMQHAVQQGRHAIILFSYELGAELHAIAPRAAQSAWAQVLLFDRCERLSADEVTAWLGGQDNHTGIGGLQASVDRVQFQQALARIHDYLEAGDTYQVNYTVRLRFDAYGSLPALYRTLRARQPVPYGALIALPDGRAVLSLSPELFLRYRRGQLTARPMKGTAAASGDAAQDAARAAALAADPKNRAENLMIVDLLRNDLGKVATLGSVRVPHLFDVSAYSSVLQMTSTVNAQLRDDVTLAGLISALYPCGSITGAPKRRTMQIIRELEPDARGIYTGAIGWLDAAAAGHGIGDFCLSVPIRTLMLEAPGADGVRAGEMGVGAGITHDSDADDEYAECQLKAQFLTGLENAFELFETMFATRAGGCRHLDLHLQRLRASAAYFGFVLDEKNLREILLRTCAALPAEGNHRLRLALNQAGAVNVQHAPLTPLPLPVRLWLSPQRTEAGDLFLRHKSTLRARYDAAWRAAEAQGAFDVLFCNTRDELTEGARSNVFIKLNGRWYTPPLGIGVLPGVMRTVLLADPAWNAQERRLTLDDLYAAEDIVVCNALRGALPATLEMKGEELRRV